MYTQVTYKEASTGKLKTHTTILRVSYVKMHNVETGRNPPTPRGRHLERTADEGTRRIHIHVQEIHEVQQYKRPREETSIQLAVQHTSTKDPVKSTDFLHTDTERKIQMH